MNNQERVEFEYGENVYITINPKRVALVKTNKEDKSKTDIKLDNNEKYTVNYNFNHVLDMLSFKKY